MSPRLVAFIYAVLLLAYPTFFLAMRLVGPTPEQQQALVLINTPMPPVTGRDGSDAVWMLGYDVPAADRVKYANQLRAYLEATWNPTPRSPKLIDPRTLLTEFAQVPKDGTCADNKPGCLAYVREHRALVESRLQAHAGQLAQALDLHQFDGMRLGVTSTSDQESPKYSRGRRLLNTHLAHLFVKGQPVEAILATCNHIAAWRRLGGNTDDLVTSMVGISNVKHGLVQLAEMLAELPASQPLPAACTEALAPALDYELSICPAIATTFRGMSASFYRDLEELKEGRNWTWFAFRYFMDKSNVDAMYAESGAKYCGSDALRNARSDQATSTWFVSDVKCSTLRKRADPVGCVLVESTPPAQGYVKYLDRRVDQAAAIALMNTVLWLRQQDSNTEHWPALLKSRPASLGLGASRAPTIKDGRIAIQMNEHFQGKSFSLPIGVIP